MIGEIIMVGGLVSFPIFARVLTKNEYGVMSLILITLTIVEAFSSAGLRHASQRYFTVYEEESLVAQFY